MFSDNTRYYSSERAKQEMKSEDFLCIQISSSARQGAFMKQTSWDQARICDANVFSFRILMVAGYAKAVKRFRLVLQNLRRRLFASC